MQPCGKLTERLALDGEFDRTYISLIERGIQSPTIRTVVRLADILGVRASEIVTRMESRLVRTGGSLSPAVRP